MTNDQEFAGPEAPVETHESYTRAGDGGTTMLGDEGNAAKTDSRLEAFGCCEEASAAIGLVVALGGSLPREMVNLLVRVQNDLYDVATDLFTPVSEQADGPTRVNDSYVTYLERGCDAYNADLPALRSFVLPGGTVAASLLHQARTVVRRAERATWRAITEHDKTVNPTTSTYLNRLSDLLFILGRAANGEHGDTLWHPGITAVQAEQQGF